MTGEITIGGKDYKIHFGMLLFEKYIDLFAKNKTSFLQIVTCIIYHGHENWCELNDEIFALKRMDVVQYVEQTKLDDNRQALEDIGELVLAFHATKDVSDLVQTGKEIIDDKKKASLNQETITEEPLLESSDSSRGNTTG